MPLQSYIDESSDGNGSHSVVMAGYIATSDSWLKFTDDWNAVLSKQNKLFFHSSNKIFTQPGSRKNAEEFYRVIETHISHAISVTVHIPDYKKIMSEYKFPESIQNNPQFKKLSDPHLLMYQALFEMSLWEAEKIGISEPIDFIFDQTSKYQKLATSTFEYMFYSADQLGIPRSKFGTFPIFKNDKETPPLQAADLFSRIIRTTTISNRTWNYTEMPWKKKENHPMPNC